MKPAPRAAKAVRKPEAITPLVQAFLILIAAVIAIPGLTYLNYRIATASQGGVDFLTHWVGTRALLAGQSPYSQDVAVRVQQMYYGRPALPGENEFLDPYMIQIEALFVPFAVIPDPTVARAAWMTLLELSTWAIFLISMRVVGWRGKPVSFGLYALYALLGYHSVRPIINGNVSTLIVLIMMVAIWAIQCRKDGFAGFLLAFAIAKPNLTIVPIALLIAWAFSTGRRRMIGWFLGSFLVLAAAGMLVVPNWPMQNLTNILRYGAYNPPTTLGQALTALLPGYGTPIGFVIYVLIAVLLVAHYLKTRGSTFEDFLPGFCLSLVAAQWLPISTDPGNFIVLTLPLAILLKSIDERPGGQLWASTLISLLLVGLWAVFLATVDRSRGNLQSPVMFFPLPAVLLIGLSLSRRIRPQGAAMQPSGA